MTDITRWSALSSQPVSPWLPRLRLLAEHIAPGEVVIDVGAGGRSLRSLIDPSCLYIPVDCVPGSPVFYDFNEYDPVPRLSGNVAVLSGFLEYTNNPRSALITVARWAPRVLLSYAPSIGDDIPARKRSGWVNHFSAERLERCVASISSSHRLIGAWEDQILYEARR